MTLREAKTSQLKIAVCIDFFADTIAGAEVNSLEVARGLKNRGHKIEIISSRSLFSKPRPLDRSFKIRYALGLYKMRELSRLIKVGYLSDIFYRFPGWIFRKSVLRHLQRKYDLIYTYSFDILRCVVDGNIETPVVFEIHNPILSRYTTLLRKASVIIAGSTDVGEKLMSEHQIVSEYIPPAINLVNFRPVRSWKKEILRRRLVLKRDEKVILFVGRLIPFKNCASLIRAFGEILEDIPQARLIIVGQGVLLMELKSLIRSLNLEKKVNFVGLLSREKTLHFMRASDLVVVPSFYESFSRVAQEALALKTPLIISSGLKEFRRIFPEIEHFDPNSIKEMSRKIIKYFEKDNAPKVKISRLYQFSIETVASKYERAFRKALNATRK